MASDFASEKTELPTARRRQELREQGQVARSTDLNAATIALVIAATLNFLGAGLTTTLKQMLQDSLSAPVRLEVDIPSLMSQFYSLARTVGGALLPFCALFLVAAVAINAVQVGFVFSTVPLAPQLERVNPISGWNRLWSSANLARGITAFLKVAVAATIVASFIGGRLPQFLHSVDSEISAFWGDLGGWLTTLAFQMALGLAALAALDYGFQLWKFEQEIKMTKEELREELRQTEGDPQIKQQRQEARRRSKTPPVHSARNERKAG